MPSWESSTISQPRTPVQKRARRSGSYASKQSGVEVRSHSSVCKKLIDWINANPDSARVFKYETGDDGAIHRLEQAFMP